MIKLSYKVESKLDSMAWQLCHGFKTDDEVAEALLGEFPTEFSPDLYVEIEHDKFPVIFIHDLERDMDYEVDIFNRTIEQIR